MMWLWLLIGLIVGAMAGWMLCALCTVAVHREQCDQIGRLRFTVNAFLERTEKYHDDQLLAKLRTFARDLLEEGG